MIKQILSALLALAALVSPAFGIEVEAPPAKYRHEPLAPYTVVRSTEHELRKLCKLDYLIRVLMVRGAGGDTTKITVAGCTQVVRRVIHIRDDLSPRDFQKVLEHEKAHLNGWRHDAN